MNIGILALQGGYAAHAEMLTRLNIACSFIRNPEELSTIDGLIIPGGESTTLLKFFENSSFLSDIKMFAEKNKPIFGTCAGAILLAKKVASPKQESLNLIDIEIKRNAYGRQINSHISAGFYYPDKNTIEMIFIRAPVITHCGQNVKVLATCDDDPVCVVQNNYLVATFHPELGTDLRLHEYFINLVKPTPAI